jgi:molybdenum cofactor cytidylyltransferase
MCSEQIIPRTGGCAGLVLAAGFGRRFGADKRRATLDGAQTLLATTLARAGAAFEELWVVLREEDDAPALGVPDDVPVIRSRQAGQGMGASLAAGIGHVLAVSEADSVAILLGDMPWIAQTTLRELCSHADVSRIVLPWYAGERGQPVIFGRQFWPALATLTGDQGGKAVIARHAQACVSVQVNDAGIVQDVDVAGDLLRPIPPDRRIPL